MPNGSNAELRQDPTAVMPGVLLGRKVDVPMPKVDLSAQTERLEFGHEMIREEEIKDLTQKVDALLSGFEGVSSLRRNADQATADFQAFAAEQYAKLDPTLPRTASLDGYRKTLQVAKERSLASVKERYDRFQEDFES